MTDDSKDELSVEKAMMGILALLAAEREERLTDSGEAQRTEVILSNAGMTASEIGRVLGRSRDAVRMTITRAKR